jgi:undecaprenyl-diphosphatase
MQVVTGFASPLWVTCVAVVLGFFMWWKRCWYRLLALTLAIPGGMALLPLLKMAFHRRRPSFEDAISIFQGYSFPSGHTMAATLLYGLLAVFAVQAFDAWRRCAWAVLGAFVMVLLIGFSRVYLGAHYLSDVLGAVAAGLAWLALSVTAVDTLRQSRSRLHACHKMKEQACAD